MEIINSILGTPLGFIKNIYLFDHSDVVIHYLTNNPDDGVFKLEGRYIINHQLKRVMGM